jgi:(p)ppGpp synthase/HD superfamily hydrolase
MATLETAIAIAARAHAGTLDKQGAPYILHPLRVMMNVKDPVARIVAVLHDVVEDTSVTFDDLRAEGFAPEVLDALKLVTHEKSTPYADYVIAAKANPIARAVKLADLDDNSERSRMMLRPDKLDRDLARVQKYLLSRRFLLDELTESDYRTALRKLPET